MSRVDTLIEDTAVFVSASVNDLPTCSAFDISIALVKLHKPSILRKYRSHRSSDVILLMSKTSLFADLLFRPEYGKP